MRKLAVVGLLVAMSGCAHGWKIRGGPEECRSMCADWGLKFTGMVGVGSQGLVGDGATACVCLDPAASQGAVSSAGGASAGMSAPIQAAAEAAAAAERERQQQRQRHLLQPAPHRS